MTTRISEHNEPHGCHVVENIVLIIVMMRECSRMRGSAMAEMPVKQALVSSTAKTVAAKWKPAEQLDLIFSISLFDHFTLLTAGVSPCAGAAMPTAADAD